jgi:hypothetical protein
MHQESSIWLRKVVANTLIKYSADCYLVGDPFKKGVPNESLHEVAPNYVRIDCIS